MSPIYWSINETTRARATANLAPLSAMHVHTAIADTMQRGTRESNARSAVVR